MAYLPLIGVALIAALGFESLLWSRRAPERMTTAIMKRGMKRSVVRGCLLGGLLVWAGYGSGILRWPFWIIAFFALLQAAVGLAPLLMLSRGDTRFQIEDMELTPQQEALQQNLQQNLARGGWQAAVLLWACAGVWALDLLLLSGR